MVALMYVIFYFILLYHLAGCYEYVHVVNCTKCDIYKNDCFPLNHDDYVTFTVKCHLSKFLYISFAEQSDYK